MIAALVALAVAGVTAMGGGSAAHGAAPAASGGHPSAAARPSGAASDPGYRFALASARPGPRPAGSAAERRAHARVERRFRAAGLRIGHDRFRVPGNGRSRNVVGIHDTPADCLVVLVAHTDSVPPAPGADDNASGVGTLVALAPRLRAIRPTCDVWLIATGAEERPYTGAADHLGALAAVPRVKRRASDLRFVLSLDEVGRGRTFHLRSPAPRPRAASSARSSAPAAARSAGSGLAARATPTTASSRSRACPRRSSACPTTRAGTPPATGRRGFRPGRSRSCAGWWSGC